MMRIFLLCAFLFLALPAQAQENLDYSAFRNIPIQHEGRIKPLQSFAAITMKTLSGDEQDANAWLAQVLFDPQSAAERPIIRIENKATLEKLGLDSKQNLFSLTTLKPALDQTQNDVQALLAKDNRTDNENALLAVHEKAAILIEIMRSFSALLPLEIIVPPPYTNEIGSPVTYWELSSIAQQINADIKNIISKKGQDPNTYTPDEMATAKMGYQIQMLENAGRQNEILRVIPASWNDSSEFFSPWALLNNGQGSLQSAFAFSLWQDLARSYRESDVQNWLKISQQIQDFTLNERPDIKSDKFQIEHFYHNVSLYIYAILAYALVIIFIRKPYARIPVITTAIAIAIHITAMALRIYILDRAPVGTLYESLLFVSLICALIGLTITFKRKSLTPLIAGNISAIGLLLMAPLFAPQGDSLEVLVAVLNTNFWLTTHVLCITAGYGACILAAVLAHVGLYKRKNNNGDIRIQKNIYQLSLLALLLTALGTALGGIWADQSWGRFWGWDPKENGALLIVLWLIWAQHGRASDHLKPAAFMAAIAALNIIVALSWFGVNLLNVGLHSYGFTSQLLGGLIAFCLIETILIAWLMLRIKRTKS